MDAPVINAGVMIVGRVTLQYYAAYK